MYRIATREKETKQEEKRIDLTTVENMIATVRQLYKQALTEPEVKDKLIRSCTSRNDALKFADRYMDSYALATSGYLQHWLDDNRPLRYLGDLLMQPDKEEREILTVAHQSQIATFQQACRAARSNLLSSYLFGDLRAAKQLIDFLQNCVVDLSEADNTECNLLHKLLLETGQHDDLKALSFATLEEFEERYNYASQVYLELKDIRPPYVATGKIENEFPSYADYLSRIATSGLIAFKEKALKIIKGSLDKWAPHIPELLHVLACYEPEKKHTHCFDIVRKCVRPTHPEWHAAFVKHYFPDLSDVCRDPKACQEIVSFIR